MTVNSISTVAASAYVGGYATNAADTPATPAPATGTAAVVLSSNDQVATNSRQIEDSSAGGVLVTQFLSASGTTIEQAPSSAVLAYLRQGLTAQGQPRPADSSVTTIA